MDWNFFVFLTAPNFPQTNENCKLRKDPTGVISLAFAEPRLSPLPTLHWLADTFLHCLFVFDGSQKRSFNNSFNHHGCNAQSLGHYTHRGDHENHWPILHKKIDSKFFILTTGNDCSSIIYLLLELSSYIDCWIDVLSLHHLDLLWAIVKCQFQ